MDEVGAIALEGSPNGGPDEATIRDALRAAQPLDPCDTSIAPWQYGPAGGASFVVAGAGQFHMSLFLGGRGILAFPDGAEVMFDWGDTTYAHYLPPAASAAFHRDYRRDGRCKGLDETRPHFAALDPSAKDRAVTEAVGRLCKGAPDGSGWCCP